MAQPGVRGAGLGMHGEAEGAESRNTGCCSRKGWCSTLTPTPRLPNR